MQNKNAADIDEFQNILGQYGIEITRNTRKTISFKHPQKAKAIRGEKLGEKYTKGTILDEFNKSTDRSDGGGRNEIGAVGENNFGLADEDIQAGFINQEIERRSRPSAQSEREQRELAERNRIAEIEAERERERRKRIKRNRYSR